MRKMAGVREEKMLFAMQAVLQGSLLTKCLDKTCLEWLLGKSVYGIMMSLLMKEFTAVFSCFETQALS